MGKQSKAKSNRRSAPAAARMPQFDTTTEAPTSAASWKRNKARESLRLPSGNVALVRRVGPEAFMEQGLMPDSLAPIVQKAINDKRGLPPKALDKALATPDMMGQMVEMIDRLAVYAVIEPAIKMPPPCLTCGELNTAATASVHDHPESEEGHLFEEGPRDEEVLYVDEVDFTDKVFIMNFCVGGTRDLERFRDEHSEAVGGLDAQSGVEGSAV